MCVRGGSDFTQKCEPASPLAKHIVMISVIMKSVHEHARLIFKLPSQSVWYLDRPRGEVRHTSLSDFFKRVKSDPTRIFRRTRINTYGMVRLRVSIISGSTQVGRSSLTKRARVDGFHPFVRSVDSPARIVGSKHT